MFAKENGAPELAESVGRSLWDFIADDSTRRLYARIHQHVRMTGRTAGVRFRCDAPNLKRYMSLTISLGDKSALLYRSQLLKVEP